MPNSMSGMHGLPSYAPKRPELQRHRQKQLKHAHKPRKHIQQRTARRRKFNIFASLSEFKQELARFRACSGLAAARSKGKRLCVHERT